MESNSRIPILKGKPFFEQLKLSINFIDSNMKLIDNSVKTSNTDEEYDYVMNILNKVDKLNEDVNNLARLLKVNNLKRMNNGFEDEIQNLKDNLRCKEIEYQLEPFKYEQNVKNNQKQFKQQFNQQISNKQISNKQFNNNQSIDNHLKNKYDQTKLESTYQFSKNQIINLNNNQNKTSSLKKKDTFILKENKNNLINKPSSNHNFIQPKDLTNDSTNDSINQNNQFSFDFKMPYNKLKNNYYPSTNFSVDESLEIEFTPGLKSRRTAKKNQILNESNSSTTTQILKQLDYKDDTFSRVGFNDNRDQLIKQDTYLKQDLLKSDFEKQQDTYLKQDLLKSDFDKQQDTLTKQIFKSPSKTIDNNVDAKAKSHKLSTPKKPPNFDFFNF